MKKLFLILFVFLGTINGKIEKFIYNEFTTFQVNHLSLELSPDEESIAYLDSFDKRSLIYISENGKKAERIDGKFYKLKSKSNYEIELKLYDDLIPTIMKDYIASYDLSNEEIDINDKNGNSINYLYLIKNKKFILNFENNSGSKMISLSQKTINAKVTINKNEETIKFELNENNRYYKISGNFYGKLVLETADNDAFIEFLTEFNKNDNYEILKDTSYKNYELNSDTSVLIIPYTQKFLTIKIASSESFKYSLANGYSNDTNYYYKSISNEMIDSVEDNNNNYIVSIDFTDIFRNISLINNEFFSFVININKNENQKVFLNYLQNSAIEPLMEESLSQTYCKDIIDNLKELFEYYIYSDIAKNPPKINGNPIHEKIDFQDRLNKVSTINRKFYEFYQEVETIIATVKDLHLNVYAEQTPKGIKFKYYRATLPFNFIIKDYGLTYRIFIKITNEIYNYDKKVQNFINLNKDIPLKSINNMDPFDYIQNWSKFRTLKNVHSQFSYTMNAISNFYFRNYPLNYSDIYRIEFEFDNDEIIRLEYLIYAPKIFNLRFENFLINYEERYGHIKEIPYDKFFVFTGKKQLYDQIGQNKVNWDTDLSHIEGNNVMKCRVDHQNFVNVIYQSSFSFQNYLEVLAKMIKCVKLFLTNDYPIIIIESKNGGGYVLLYDILLQILQTRIEMKDFISYRVTPTSEPFLKKKYFSEFVTTDDCKIIYDYNDINKFYEDDYNDNSIHHNRTSPKDSIEFFHRLALEELRQEVKNNKFLKKPTEIIILTDSYSYSATSWFIKGFQNTGGAVIVGYYGNPKIKGTENYDGSQSPSIVDKLTNTKIKNGLEKNGFKIAGVTISESYNFHQKNIKNQIPREYALDPVDFRIDLFSDYSDEKYQDFIDGGLYIYNLLNNDMQCNPKNNKLLMHSDNCYNIAGDIHAHGGYKCGNDGKWNYTECFPYYCDIGYYFDQIQKKCIENCKFQKIKSYYIYEEPFDKTFKIEKDMEYYFIFTLLNNHKYMDSNNKYISGEILHIKGNNIRAFDYNIKQVSTNKNLLNLGNKYSSYSFITDTESLIFLENLEDDYVLYLDNIYKNSNAKTKLKLAKNVDEMSIDDILSINNKYYSDFNDNIHIFEKNQRYLLYVNFNGLDPFNIFISPKYEQEIIEINELEIDFLYLEKDKIYNLKFKNNLINRMLKLSRETINSEIIIQGKNIILNSKNLYYQIEDNYKGDLILNIKNENAIVEFLFKQENSELEILDFEQKVFELNKKYNILSIPKKYKSKLIDIELSRNEFLTNFTIYLAYCIPPYNYFSLDDEENIFTMDEKFTFTINEHYEGDFDFMENEYYCVMIENFGENVLMSLNIREQDKKSEGDKEGDKEDDKLEDWKLALIIISSIIVFILLALVLYISCRHCCI